MAKKTESHHEMKGSSSRKPDHQNQGQGKDSGKADDNQQQGKKGWSGNLDDNQQQGKSGWSGNLGDNQQHGKNGWSDNVNNYSPQGGSKVGTPIGDQTTSGCLPKLFTSIKNGCFPKMLILILPFVAVGAILLLRT